MLLFCIGLSITWLVKHWSMFSLEHGAYKTFDLQRNFGTTVWMFILACCVFFALHTCSIFVPKSPALKLCHCLLLFNIAPILVSIAIGLPLHWHHNVAPTLAQYCNIGRCGPNMSILGHYCANIVCQQGSHFASASGGLRPGPLPAPGPHWETYVPQIPWLCPTTWTPSIVKSWVRRVSLQIHRNQGRPKCVTESSGDKKN